MAVKTANTRIGFGPYLPKVTDPQLTAVCRSITEMFTRLITRDNAVLSKAGDERMEGPLPLMQVAKADLLGLTPVWAAADYEGSILYVTDETGGKTLAFSDGTDWRRVQDRAVVS